MRIADFELKIYTVEQENAVNESYMMDGRNVF